MATSVRPDPRGPIDYAEAGRIIRRHKSALTRARKQGPEAVLRAVHAAYEEWDDRDVPWPDAWSTWQVAHDDALGYPWHPSPSCTPRCSR